MELAKTLAKTQNVQNQLQRSTVDKTFQQNIVILPSTTINAKDMPDIYWTEDVDASDAWIIGHPVYGVLDGDRVFRSNDYIKTNYGSITKIVNANGRFNHFLTAKEVEYLKHSSTDCTIDSSALTATFTAGQILQIYCYKDSATIQEMRVNLDSRMFDDETNYTFWLSADNGSHFQQVINGTWTIPNYPGTTLILKIISTGTGVISLRDNVTGNKYPLRVEYR